MPGRHAGGAAQSAVAAVRPQLAAVDPPGRACRRWRPGCCALPRQSLPGRPHAMREAIARAARHGRAGLGGSGRRDRRPATFCSGAAACISTKREAAFRGRGRPTWRGRRALGVTVDLLTPDEVAADGAGPATGRRAGRPSSRRRVFLNDPGRMMRLLAAAVQAAGVHRLRAAVEQLERLVDGVALHGPGLQLHARRVVIAAGAHSRALAAQAGDRVPLDTERGYHVEWDMAAAPAVAPRLPHRARVLPLPDGRAAAGGGHGGTGRADRARPRRTASRGWSRARGRSFPTWANRTATGWASARRCPTACR